MIVIEDFKPQPKTRGEQLRVVNQMVMKRFGCQLSSHYDRHDHLEPYTGFVPFLTTDSQYVVIDFRTMNIHLGGTYQRAHNAIDGLA